MSTLAPPLAPPTSPPARPDCRAAVVDSLLGLDRLLEAWPAVAEHSPLAEPAWARAALWAAGDSATPFVLALWREEALAALATCNCRWIRGVPRLALAGVEGIAPPFDFSAVDASALEALILSLRDTGLPLLFQRLPAEANTLRLIRRAYGQRGLVLLRPQPACPYLPLEERWLHPQNCLSPSATADLRRARQKAEQLGPLTFEFHAPGLDQLPELLDEAFEVEAPPQPASERERLCQLQQALFFRRYAKTACMADALRIGFLRIAGRAVAMLLAVEQAGGFWVLKSGHDPRLAACWPGMLLTAEAVRYAVEAGLKTYEFLDSAERWTQSWTPAARPTVSLHAYPLSVRGAAAALTDAGATLYRRWRQRRANTVEKLAPKGLIRPTRRGARPRAAT